MIWLLGCGTVEPPPADSGTTPVEAILAPLAPVSTSCPDLTTPGEVVLDVAGVDRRVLLQLPADRPPGMPVLVVWHGLGQSPERMFEQMELTAFAEQHQMVVVAPGSTVASGPSWDLTGGVDAVLYDDLRTCLAEQLDVDLERYYTAGFSFGAWFAVWLAENRGDTLAAVHVLSGGIHEDTVTWQRPAWPLPFLVSWGGPEDTYSDTVGHSFVFSETSAALAAAATPDGHVVLTCEHDGGHAIPDTIVPLNDAWFAEGHRFGQQSPFVDGAGDLSTLCVPAR